MRGMNCSGESGVLSLRFSSLCLRASIFSTAERMRFLYSAASAAVVTGGCKFGMMIALLTVGCGRKSIADSASYIASPSRTCRCKSSIRRGRVKEEGREVEEESAAVVGTAVAPDDEAAEETCVSVAADEGACAEDMLNRFLKGDQCYHERASTTIALVECDAISSTSVNVSDSLSRLIDRRL